MMQFSLIQKIRIGFAAAILLMAFITFFSIGSIYNLNQREKNVTHTFAVLIKLEEVLSIVKDAETGARGYVMSNEIEYLQPYENATNTIDLQLDELRKLISDNPEQIENYKKLRQLVNKRIGIIKVFLYYFHTERKDILFELIKEGKGNKTMVEVRRMVKTMKDYEKKVLEERKEISRFSSQMTYLIISFGNMLAISCIIAAIYFISIDITKRKEAENTLMKRQASLEQLNKELEAFSYTISHDLRSPLRAIDGFGKIFSEEYSSKLDEEGKRVLGIIRNNALKMGQLIDDLLDFSRLSRKEVVQSTYNMQEIVHGAIQEVRNGNPSWNPKIVIKDIVDAPSDPSLMNQVWVNLISNAFKYSSRKTDARIEIGSFIKETDVEYYVQDNGEGFDMQYKDKLFGIFQRLHSVKEFEGTGVGLAIVNRIIARHGGTMDAYGILGKGAKFSFTLPIQHPLKK